MQNSNKKIPYPEEIEIDQEISTILTEGMDSRANFWSFLLTMYRQLGFRIIFRDFTEIIYTIILSIVVVTGLLMSLGDLLIWNDWNVYTIIFTFSPVTYLLFAYFFFIFQKQKPTYEVEMVCKYNLYQLAAFRMLTFSIVSMLVNSVFIIGLMMDQSIHFGYAFLLSSSSLFLFAVILLYVQLYVFSRLVKLLLAIGWLLGNILASIFSEGLYLIILQQIPLYIYGMIVIGSFVVYLKGLKKLLFASQRERMS
ncbi:hypothetical protein F9U64_21815 [Gracilibacillus oryzae]|uniref:Uncharacterized protein n=1 Tax=Gracilibacillus oryzae TaxID=1672701 RepID=A0A7C8KM59_9BACI|nr:hypothetical protein [Gracilibacillus oryzae]KAB8125737.1 hypothetical protein F9U64_21815 [Gracilibacillus oryzae]